MAPIACSRSRWRFRPAGFCALKSPAPSKVSRVLHDGPRSAEPPSIHGTFLASAFSAWPDASRVAALPSEENAGNPLSQPSGSSRRSMR